MDAYVSKPIEARLLLEASRAWYRRPCRKRNVAERPSPSRRSPTTGVFNSEGALAMWTGDTENPFFFFFFLARKTFGAWKSLGFFMSESVDLLNQIP